MGAVGHRLAILVSGAPGHEEGKLLTVATLTDGTGEAQADATFNAIEDWRLAESVVGLCFDTTATNTGRQRGAATRLQRALEKDLLLLACRHHMLELVVRGVAAELFGKTTGPTDKKFSELKDRYGLTYRADFLGRMGTGSVKLSLICLKLPSRAENWGGGGLCIGSL